jgi:hypothetical protein
MFKANNFCQSELGALCYYRIYSRHNNISRYVMFHQVTDAQARRRLNMRRLILLMQQLANLEPYDSNLGPYSGYPSKGFNLHFFFQFLRLIRDHDLT